MKIKIIEDTREVWWQTTHEGKIEIDGEILEFRYAENPNSAEIYIKTNDEWSEVYDEDSTAIKNLQEVLAEYSMEDLKGEGQEFEL